MGIRVLVIDSSTLARAGLVAILEEHDDIVIAGCATDEPTALEACLDSTPDVVVISALGSSIDVASLVRRLAGLREDGAERVLLIGGGNEELLLQARKLGVGGLVLSWESPRVLVAAIRMVAHRYAVTAPLRPRPESPQRPRPDDPRAAKVHSGVLKRLTHREREVLQLLAKGLKNAEIASELVLSESTVKSHVQSVLSKLGLRNRASAVAISYQLGIARVGEEDPPP